MGDKGYAGHCKIVTPFKGADFLLTPAQVAWNTALNAKRTIVERTFGRLKEFGALGDIWKHNKTLHPFVFAVCAHLTNLKIQLHPL